MTDSWRDNFPEGWFGKIARLLRDPYANATCEGNVIL